MKAEARKEAIANQRLQAAHCVHFACHGIFDLESPLRSALVLAGVDLNELELERCLTLGEIFGLNLSQCRLVTLSACETGLPIRLLSTMSTSVCPADFCMQEVPASSVRCGRLAIYLRLSW